MSTKNRSRLLLACIPAVLAASLLAVGAAPVANAQSATQTKWSDPATWPNNKVPAAGDLVEIATGKDVVLDVSPPALNGVTINGKLSFANNADLELTTEWIMVHGELAIGTEAIPHTRKATITLTDKVKGENIMGGMGDRGIMLSGGTLNLHGDRTNTWTKLSATAKAGATAITVLNAAGWRVGDEIVLASTDYDPRQAERRSITAIKGNTLTLDKKLDYMHFGKITFDVDERGEVGLLTRNIKVQASDDAAQSFFGGHIMAMPTSKMFVEGVELNRMGQNLTLARYPIHWHLVGDALGQYVRNSAIHDTYNRCVTVHGTNDLRVENNVTYNTVGHCFFMEDGIEHGNQFVHNLGIQTKCHTSKPCDPTNLAPFGPDGGTNFKTTGQTSKDVLIPSDNTASTYWITNPNNTYRDNVAAGSDAIGFWYGLPEHPTGAFEGTEASKAAWPRRTPLREFKGNVSHSNFDGLMSDRGPRPDGQFRTGGHIGLANPADPTSQQVASVIEDFTSYKNRNGGLWARGEMDLFKNLKMADNAIGYTHASANFGNSAYTSRVVDSLFVGETENIGNPITASEKAYGRSLPEPTLADFPIRGYEFYDFRHELDNVTFVNFKDNATRKTGAVSYLLFTSYGMSSNNTIQRAKFVNAKPVYFPPIERKWGNDDAGSGSYKTAVFHDLDGSVSGVANSFIVINGGIVGDEGCTPQPTWNASVCKGDIGRMTVGAVRGAGGPGAPRAAGTPPAPLPPVTLTRNGRDFTITGETNVRAGSEFKVSTDRPTLALNVKEMDTGSWVIFELPGFTAAAEGTEQSSLDALRKATATSYYKANGSLWVKLVSVGDVLGSGSGKGPGGGVTLTANR